MRTLGIFLRPPEWTCGFLLGPDLAQRIALIELLALYRNADADGISDVLKRILA
jgi:hypothetical protein